MVSRDHDDFDAGALRFRNGLAHTRAHGVLEGKQPEELKISIRFAARPVLKVLPRAASTLCPSAPSCSVLASQVPLCSGDKLLIAMIVSGAPLTAATNVAAALGDTRLASPVLGEGKGRDDQLLGTGHAFEHRDVDRVAAPGARRECCRVA